jgi:ParB/RepB/Spo0J family partition protein
MNNTNEVDKTQAVYIPPPLAIEQGVWVPINGILVPPDAREHPPEDVDSRAASMAKEGQLQPILLSKEGDQYVLVFGQGRLLSAQKLGWEKIRAEVREGLSETQKLLMTLAENSEREDVSPFYTAHLYKRIMAAEKLSPEQLPDYLKKDRSTVYRVLAIGKLPGEVEAMSHRCDIGFTHLTEIAKSRKEWRRRLPSRSNRRSRIPSRSAGREKAG